MKRVRYPQEKTIFYYKPSKKRGHWDAINVADGSVYAKELLSDSEVLEKLLYGDMEIIPDSEPEHANEDKSSRWYKSSLTNSILYEGHDDTMIWITNKESKLEVSVNSKDYFTKITNKQSVAKLETAYEDFYQQTMDVLKKENP